MFVPVQYSALVLYTRRLILGKGRGGFLNKQINEEEKQSRSKAEIHRAEQASIQACSG